MFAKKALAPVSRTLLAALGLLALLAVALPPRAALAQEDISAEQDARLQKAIPRTYAKLLRRESVHILAIGDSITEVTTPGLGKMPTLQSYYGTFAQRLARFFFYTGEVRHINPRQGEIDKFSPDMGPEITIENMGMGGRYIYHGMQRLWTDALVNKPDLVLINFGVNDATSGMPLWEYVAAYRRVVEFLREQKIDIILLGPTYNMTGDPYESLALTPPFASGLEDTARELGVAYYDLAPATWTSYFEINGLNAQEALDRTLKTARTLHIGADGVFDGLHPNAAGQKRMGDHIFERMMGAAPDTADFKVEGTYVLDAQGDAEASYTLTNLTQERRLGYVTVLPFGAAQRPDRTDIPRFDIPAGGKATFKQKLKLWGGGFTEDFSKNYDLLPAHENFIRAPFLVMDDRRSQILVEKLPQTPVSFIWKPGRLDKLTTQVSAFALMFNETKAPISGSFDARWNKLSAKGEFTIAAGGKQPLQLNFPLDQEAYHQDGPLEMTVTLSNGQVILVRRDLEVVRNLTLGQKVNMNRWISRPDTDPKTSQNQFQFQVDADANGLTITAEFSGFPWEEVPGKPMATLSMGFDGQERGARGQHGFYRKTVAGIPFRGTTIEFMDFRRANFGVTYGERLTSDSLRYTMERLPGDKFRVSVTYPRPLFYRHEWELENRDSWIGFDLNFTPADKEVEGTFSHDNETVWIKNGLAYPDAYCTGVLELTHTPSPYHRSILE
jgi:lysophospholipase L1-like esterase